MKKTLLASACALAIGVGADPASAQGLYFSLLVGGTSIDGAEFDDDNTFVGFRNLPIDPGIAAAFAVGFGTPAGFRFDFETSASEVEIPTTQFEGTVSGDARVYGAMANIWFDFNLGGRIVPYIGGGIGAAHVDFKLDNTTNNDVDDNETVFAYQLGAGAGIPINPNVMFTVDYRLFGTDDFFMPHNGSNQEEGVNGSLLAQTVMVGLRFNFSAPPPPPP